MNKRQCKKKNQPPYRKATIKKLKKMYPIKDIVPNSMKKDIVLTKNIWAIMGRVVISNKPDEIDSYIDFNNKHRRKTYNRFLYSSTAKPTTKEEFQYVYEHQHQYYLSIKYREYLENIEYLEKVLGKYISDSRYINIV